MQHEIRAFGLQIRKCEIQLIGLIKLMNNETFSGSGSQIKRKSIFNIYIQFKMVKSN